MAALMACLKAVLLVYRKAGRMGCQMAAAMAGPKAVHLDVTTAALWVESWVWRTVAHWGATRVAPTAANWVSQWAASKGVLMAALKENLMAGPTAALWASPKAESKAVKWGVTKADPTVGCLVELRAVDWGA